MRCSTSALERPAPGPELWGSAYAHCCRSMPQATYKTRLLKAEESDCRLPAEPITLLEASESFFAYQPVLKALQASRKPQCRCRSCFRWTALARCLLFTSHSSQTECRFCRCTRSGKRNTGSAALDKAVGICAQSRPVRVMQICSRMCWQHHCKPLRAMQVGMPDYLREHSTWDLSMLAKPGQEAGEQSMPALANIGPHVNPTHPHPACWMNGLAPLTCAFPCFCDVCVAPALEAAHDSSNLAACPH